MKKRESLLWQKINKALPKAHLTRIESNTLQGIPDINGVWSAKSFWIELKSDKSSFPKLSKWQVAWINKHIYRGGTVLICNETLLERRLKLYRPLSAITDPRSLVPDFSLSFPVHWPTFRKACWDLLQRPHASDALARFDTEAWAQDNGKKNSLDELELSRS
jgi:hypothetical protein